MRNFIGNAFRIVLSGESHSPLMSVEIQGVPEGLPLSPKDLAADIARRRPGRKGTTARVETDVPEIVRGVEGGVTTGTTLKIVFRNQNIDPSAYRQFVDMPRPGHADWVRRIKYGADSLTSGGGMFSGRMTLPLVAAGVVARKIIAPVTVSARLIEVGGHLVNGLDDPVLEAVLTEAAEEGDSVGGVIECVCTGVPAGLGEPFFCPMEAALSQMVLSIPGIRGIEFGDGFGAARMRGSQHNDPIVDEAGHTSRNGAGGINGGLTNGNPIVFRVAVKPTSSIARPQMTVNLSTGRMETLTVKGRHDTCFALRVPPVIESAAAIVLCDSLLSTRI